MGRWEAVISAVFICTGLGGQAQGRERYEGLSGAELAAAIRADYAPKHLVSALPVADWRPDDWPAWWPASWPADASIVGQFVPESWFKEGPVYDLYNLSGSCLDFERHKKDYPPGQLNQIEEHADGWAVGIGSISGIDTNMWEVADDRRGDAARRIMYMALIHPQRLWGGRGAMLMADGQWPLLTTYGRQLLAKWAQDDPIDDRERAESDIIARAQGNENPFIVYPDLFNFLWGEDAGQGYIPDEKRERVPLKASYSRSADQFIDLYSPYVGDGASWTLDGYEVEDDSVSLDSVENGWHVLAYRLGSAHGKIKIFVMP